MGQRGPLGPPTFDNYVDIHKLANINYGLPDTDVNLRSSVGGFVAAKKKSQRKVASASGKRQVHIDAVKEARAALKVAENIFKDLNIELKKLRKKVDCLPHDPHIG